MKKALEMVMVCWWFYFFVKLRNKAQSCLVGLGFNFFCSIIGFVMQHSDEFV